MPYEGDLRKTRNGGWQRWKRGYRPVVSARHGLMWGMRNPFDGPVFDTLTDAINWCMVVMVAHHDRTDGLSDARIEPFDGWVTTFPPVNLTSR